MNKQLTALYLEYENELKATVPDFAHQLEQLVKVKSQPVNYDNKPVAAYEQEVYYEEESKLHPDFELNVNFLSHFETNMVLSVFEKHFPDDKMKHAEQIALLADSFSNAQLQNFMKDEMEKIDNMEEEFEAAGAKGKGPHTEEEKEFLDKTKEDFFRGSNGGLTKKEAEELNPHTKRATVENEMRHYNYSKGKKSRELERRLREEEMKEALRKKEMKEAKKKQEGKSTLRRMKDVVFRESDEVEVDLDELSINEELETDIEPHCGKKKKHKEQELIMPLQHCDTCEFAHADHFRLCEHCNEEHDGCCEVLA